MSIARIARQLLRLPYQAATLPLRIVEQQLAGRLFGEDSGVRTGLEKLLGGLDTTAGRVLDDESLREQGQRSGRAAEALQRANDLERDAAQRRDSAERQFDEESHRAREKREAAQDNKQERIGQALRAQQSDTQVVNKLAEQKTKDDKHAADTQAQRRKQQAKTEQDNAERVTRARTETATAAPKNELKQAAEDKKTAHQQARDAKELESLAVQAKKS